MPFWTMRAAKSVCPPGGKPTTIVTGREGHACARASLGAARPPASEASPAPSAARRWSGGDASFLTGMRLVSFPVPQTEPPSRALERAFHDQIGLRGHEPPPDDGARVPASQGRTVGAGPWL